MPLAGALTKKATFKRSAAGSLQLGTGTATGLKGVFKAVAGSMGRFAGALTHKVMFKRTVEGSLHMTGDGARTWARFHKSVSGAIRFTGALGALTGVAKAAAGFLRFTGTLTHKVMFKRSVDGEIRASGTATESIPFRKRTVEGFLSRWSGGATRLAATTFVKKGLSRFGFNFKQD